MAAANFLLSGYALLHRFATRVGKWRVRRRATNESFATGATPITQESQPETARTHAAHQLHPCEVTGLNKSEAEILLDGLEGSGGHHFEVSQVTKDGFNVRFD